ncbi:acyltransferase family protein [Flexivirga sp. ID2601S]|uniref:Acyltransferase family protein n=2 Tax=Flexivirga aerilata TaxID=1656889 RepID=A0A849AAH6_9MICO|nr:lysophospholipid acyltransferase family protein [Flexivirga aerilata]NNG37924.1 acyltransferase family protein [Flexivirga aerilata]
MTAKKATATKATAKKATAKKEPVKKASATTQSATAQPAKRAAAKSGSARQRATIESASAVESAPLVEPALPAESVPAVESAPPAQSPPPVKSAPAAKTAPPPQSAPAERPSRRRIAAAAQVSPAPAVARPAAYQDEQRERTLRVVPDPPEPPAPSAVSAVSADDFEGVVGMLVSALRTGGSMIGLRGDDLERKVAQALAFLRRRLTGDYEIDDFGFDKEFTEQVWLPMLRPLYKRWFRVEVRGIENIPDEGAALVVANHSGTLPLDGLMTQVAIYDAHPKHRHVRMLGADLVFESPLIGELSRKAGTTLASNPDVERLLGAGELTAVWPEGFKGVGKPFSERYKLQRFGRGGFVSAALRAGVPIIPCAIVGAEEIYPMLGNVKGLARLLGFPYFPITPFFPLLGLAGVIPLPSKWIIEFGTPVETEAFGPAAAEDPMLVFDLTDQVRETIQQSLYSLLLQRRSVFF